MAQRNCKFHWGLVLGVVGLRLARQRLERDLVYRVSFAEVYRSPLVATQGRVEELPPKEALEIHVFALTPGTETPRSLVFR